MKKKISVLLLISLCIPLWGCQPKTEPVKSPVTFYYCREEFDHGKEDSVILGEIRDQAGFEDNLTGLLDIYLQGPVSENLHSTFPYGTVVREYRVEDTTAVLTLSHQLSLAEGMDLTIACACLTKTVLELTGLDTVRIYTQTANLENNSYIQMDRNTLLLIDSTEIHP